MPPSPSGVQFVKAGGCPTPVVVQCVAPVTSGAEQFLKLGPVGAASDAWAEGGVEIAGAGAIAIAGAGLDPGGLHIGGGIGPFPAR